MLSSTIVFSSLLVSPPAAPGVNDDADNGFDDVDDDNDDDSNCAIC